MGQIYCTHGRHAGDPDGHVFNGRCSWCATEVAVGDEVDLALTALPAAGAAGDGDAPEARPRLLPAPAALPRPADPGRTVDQLDLFAVAATDSVRMASARSTPAATANTRTLDPTTSHQAAEKVRNRTKADTELVLVAHARAGARGLTGDELEQATGRPYQSVGPRRPALEKQLGYIAKRTDATGRVVTRTNRRGNSETVYAITPAGLAAARRLLEVAS